MTKGAYLGEFELLVLISVGRLGGDAYAVTIQRELERRAKRRASIGAIHAALGRLADKGYLAFRISEPLPMPGGRARKYATMTTAGARALRNSVGTIGRMLDGLELGVKL
jgi:DNA-binding PadR family transcriptional regulator